MAKTAIKKDLSTPATGRRKSSVARVHITEGKGNIVINDKDIETYFGMETLKQIVRQLLVLTNNADKLDITVNVYGGGLSGQAGAIRHAIARALVKYNEENKALLKTAGLLTRDPRMKERKKYGLHKARRAVQFSKR